MYEILSVLNVVTDFKLICRRMPMSTRLYVGIDPGLTGAVAEIDIEDRIVTLFDTPITTIKVGKKIKTDYMPSEMASILERYTGTFCHVFIEKVGAMPGQGVVSMFGFGKGFGLWLGILAALALPYTLVTPQAWKKVIMEGKADKDAARLRAQELFPKVTGDLSRKKDIGRADALLIAEYGRRIGK